MTAPLPLTSGGLDEQLLVDGLAPLRVLLLLLNQKLLDLLLLAEPLGLADLGGACAERGGGRRGWEGGGERMRKEGTGKLNKSAAAATFRVPSPIRYIRSLQTQRFIY
jgi:hypothetical protein